MFNQQPKTAISKSIMIDKFRQIQTQNNKYWIEFATQYSIDKLQMNEQMKRRNWIRNEKKKKKPNKIKLIGLCRE